MTAQQTWARRAVGGALTLALAACSATGGSARPTVTLTPDPQGLQDVTLTVDDHNHVAPATIAARTGMLRVTVRNIGKVSHGWAIAGMPISTVYPMVGGDQRTVRVMLTTPGRYRMDVTTADRAYAAGVLLVRNG